MNQPPSVSLAEATDLLTDGTHYTPPDIGAGIPFLTVKDVTDRGLDFVHSAKISEEEFARAKDQNSAPKLGDVLFSKDGTVGKVHLVTEPQPFAVLSSLAILRPGKHLHSGYLAHFLRTPSALSAAERRKTGSAIRRIVLRDLAALSIPLPPLDEQRRITAILDKADALRQQRKRAIALFGSLTQSIFIEMFGDPKREIERWELLPFESACADETSKSDKLQRGEFTASGRFPVIDQGQSFIGGWTDKNMLCPTALPVVVFGDHTRIVKYVEEPFVVGADGAKVIKPKERYDALFFAWLLRLMPLPDLGYSRHMRELKRLSFWVPPIDLQGKFADHARQIEIRVKQCARQLADLDLAFSALQDRAFSMQRLEA